MNVPFRDTSRICILQLILEKHLEFRTCTKSLKNGIGIRSPDFGTSFSEAKMIKNVVKVNHERSVEAKMFDGCSDMLVLCRCMQMHCVWLSHKRHLQVSLEMVFVEDLTSHDDIS